MNQSKKTKTDDAQSPDSHTSSATLSWQDESTFELTITIPLKEIKASYQKSLEEIAKQAQLSGFRPGKAPKELVEKQVGKETIYKKAIETIIPDAYQEALKKNNLRPILEPKITLVSAEEDKDWVFKASSCQMPKVELGNYKEEVHKAIPQAKIWTPEKGTKEPSEQDKEKEKQERFEQIIKKLIEVAKVGISPLLIDAESSKKLVSLIDQLQKAGLSIDQYASTKGMSVESLREEYRKQAEMELKLEFILQQIADEEGIKVEEKELNQIVENAKKQSADKGKSLNIYLVAQILRRQKTIDYLAHL